MSEYENKLQDMERLANWLRVELNTLAGSRDYWQDIASRRAVLQDELQAEVDRLRADNAAAVQSGEVRRLQAEVERLEAIAHDRLARLDRMTKAADKANNVIDALTMAMEDEGYDITYP